MPYLPPGEAASTSASPSVLSSASSAIPIGGCYDTTRDVLISCAKDPNFCTSLNSQDDSTNISYKTNAQLQNLQGYMNMECTTDQLPVGTCHTRDSEMAISTLATIFVNRECAYDVYSCDTTKNKFIDSESFFGCNVHGMFYDGFYVPTQYGSCQNLYDTSKQMCARTPSDCNSNDKWLTPIETIKALKERERTGVKTDTAKMSDAEKDRQKLREIAYKNQAKYGCRCHDIHLGVCAGRAGVESKCALSSAECGMNQDFLSGEQIENSDSSYEWAELNCRLCPYNEETMTTIEHWEPIENKSEFFTGEIVGLLFGMMATLIVGAGIWVCWRKRRGMYRGNSRVKTEEDDHEEVDATNIPEIS